MLKTKQVILMTVLFILFLPVFVHAGGGVVDLPKTGQTTCYDSIDGTAIPCAGTGQDGDIQAGVAWPSPRFTNNGDGTVTDNLTGLMWTQDGNAPGPFSCSPTADKTWQGALDYVACLNSNSYLGYTDWRLSNVNELESLINSEQNNSAAWLNTQGFSNVPSNIYYWSSTSLAFRTSGAWAVGLDQPNVFNSGKLFKNWMWPVRSGQLGLVELWKTGQTTSYVPGDDGDIQAGAAWPSTRFTISGDCVTDNLTGLMWAKNVNLSGFAMSWQQSLDFSNGLSLCGYTDWRLPNRKELHSLTDFSQRNPALPSGHPFLSVQPGCYCAYWSSTSGAGYSTNFAYTVNIFDGNVSGAVRTNNNYVWPVRGNLIHSITGSITENGVGLESVNMNLTGDSSSTTTTATDGTYSFTNLADGSYTVTPSMSNYNFTPPSRSVTLAGADVSAQDFVATCIQHTYYHDLDGDTYGNAVDTIQSCTQPFGYVTNSADCNDSSASVNPDAVEVCNGIDENCNGQIDEGCIPDLIVTILTTPWTTLPGQSILLSDTTKNQGTADAGASTTKFYWSANAFLDNSDVLLGTRSVPSLAAGAISSGSTSVTVPSPLTCSGMTTFYIISKADADGVVAESNENNNKRNRIIKVGPDLIIPVLTAPLNAGAGKTISVGDTTKNIGGCTAGASTTKFYLSADTILDSGDTLLGSRAVPSITSGAISSGTTSVTIPAGTATGKYFIIAWSDADSVVAETYEGNNKKVRAINILPDLIVSILSAPNTASAGATITISETTKNIGGSTAAASTTKFYFSTNTTYDTGDTLLGSRSIPFLGAGATDSGGTSVTIAAGTLSGTYYIIGRADADAVVAETNESNNNKYRLITVP
ncbi:MAG: DUF1566 domain-containing protein [Nitrospirae bacterium]|nr:DUF1566 domain-containing protein [Nitrospirota bacterium]